MARTATAIRHTLTGSPSCEKANCCSEQFVPGMTLGVSPFTGTSSFSKFFLQPLFECVKILRPSQKIADQIVRRHAAAGFENGFSVAQRRFKDEGPAKVKLCEEVLDDHSIPII